MKTYYYFVAFRKDIRDTSQPGRAQLMQSSPRLEAIVSRPLNQIQKAPIFSKVKAKNIGGCHIARAHLIKRFCLDLQTQILRLIFPMLQRQNFRC